MCISRLVLVDYAVDSHPPARLVFQVFFWEKAKRRMALIYLLVTV